MLIQRARSLRKAMTPWEVRLWGRLRGNQFSARFRRQHPIGNAIADFACLPARVVVEVDGEHHFQHGSDQTRDARLSAAGWHVMRFSNHAVQWELDEVCWSIGLVLKGRLLAGVHSCGNAPIVKHSRDTSPTLCAGEEAPSRHASITRP